jgi:hypothetical protein
MSKRKMKWLEWLDSDYHTDLGYLFVLLVGVPLGLISGAIAGMCAADAVPGARVWQALARGALLVAVLLVAPIAAGVWQPPAPYWVVVAGAWTAVIVFANIAEYQNLQPDRPNKALQQNRDDVLRS